MLRNLPLAETFSRKSTKVHQTMEPQPDTQQNKHAPRRGDFVARVVRQDNLGPLHRSLILTLTGDAVGAFLAALQSKDFAFRLPTPGRFVQQTAGGALMGIGASIAGGCNIGHGITGLSALSVTSLVATVFTMIGVWSGTWIIFRALRSPAKPEGERR